MLYALTAMLYQTSANWLFDKGQQLIASVMQDMQSGARSAVRRAVQFIHFQRQAAKSAQLESELAAEQADNDKLRDELKKQRKTKDAPFRNAGHGNKPTTPDKAPLPHSATKSLASAFESWRL
jgi:hypothetical protein